MVTDRQYSLPDVNRGEVLRYAGVREASSDLSSLLEDVIREAEGQIAGRIVWAEYPIEETPEYIHLGFARCRSESLRRHLHGCKSVIVFAATLGIGIDRLISRYSRTSPSRALMFQALGAERIEQLCDIFCDEIHQRAAELDLNSTARFSPGYGDLPLSLQQDIFRVLDCSRKIGLTLNESLLMSPSKSVTAIVGLGQCPGHSHLPGCAGCSKTNCAFRRNPCELQNS